MTTYNSRTADKFVVRMPDDMRAKVEAASGEQHISMNTFLVQAIEDKLDGYGRIRAMIDALTARLKPSRTYTLEATGETFEVVGEARGDDGRMVTVYRHTTTGALHYCTADEFAQRMYVAEAEARAA